MILILNFANIGWNMASKSKPVKFSLNILIQTLFVLLKILLDNITTHFMSLCQVNYWVAHRH